MRGIRADIRLDIGVERLLMRFGTRCDGLFGDRFFVVPKLFQLRNELAIALRTNVGQPVHQRRRTLGEIRQRLAGIAIHRGDGQRAHGEAIRRHIRVKCQILTGFASCSHQCRSVVRRNGHTVISGHVIADAAGDGESDDRCQIGRFVGINGMQGDANANHSGSAGNFGSAHIGTVKSECGGHFPRHCHSAFGNAL